MFQALIRFFRRKSKEPAPRSAAPPSTAARPTPSSPQVTRGRPSPPPPAPAPGEEARQVWEQESSKRLPREVSPEELCGITPEMSAGEIRDRIAFLYQRHNRAASSLDPGLQSDASYMLENLALLREKYFGAPEGS